LDSNRTAEGGGSLLLSITKEALSTPYSDRACRFIDLCFTQYWKQHPLTGDGLATFEELFPFRQLETIVTDSFLSDNDVQQIINPLNDLEKAVSQLYQTSMKPNLGLDLQKVIVCVLEAYYQLYWTILRNFSTLIKGLNAQGGIQERHGYTFLRILLNLGCSFEIDGVGSQHIIGIVTPFAPRFLSTIFEVSQQLPHLCSGADVSLSLESPDAILVGTEIEILNTFISRYLRWFLLSPDGTLCHAAARTITSIPREQTDICSVIRPISDYSSFEGIGEPRLFEKIKYELKRQVKKKTDEGLNKRWSSLHILIAGDIDAKQIVKFGRILEGWLDSWPVAPEDGNAQLTFLLFTDNCSLSPKPSAQWVQYVNSLHWIRMEQAPLSNLFTEPRTLKSQVQRADLLFFLDCRQLYHDLYAVPSANLNAFFQQTVDLDIPAALRSASGGVLSPNNPFFQIQDLLLGALYGKGGPAVLKKDINTTWLTHIKELLRVQKKTAYFYYSDLNAAQDLYWEEECFVRLEEYAGKNMIILRSGSQSEPSLEAAPNDRARVIVFNLWQFIRHSNLRRVDGLMQDLRLCQQPNDDSTKDIHLLSNILVGIDYSNWPSNLRLSYSYPDEEPRFQNTEFQTSLRKYLEYIVLPCFQRERQNMYYEYFRKCIASFLYSDAKSVDDMLFIHIFRRHFSLLQHASLEQEKYYDRLSLLQANGIKYSGKRFYQEAINDYDEPSRYVADQHRKLARMEKEGCLLPAKVFCDIRRACEKNQYLNSNLYRNCTKWLDDNNYLLYSL